jgi:quercetin dioxygenase-like cupin family protein
MSMPETAPAQLMDIRPLGAALRTTATAPLMNADRFRVMRLVILTGKDVPPHKASGDLLVQCLEGRVVFTAQSRDQELRAGDMLHLPSGEEHSLKALEDASVLVTVIR